MMLYDDMHNVMLEKGKSEKSESGIKLEILRFPKTDPVGFQTLWKSVYMYLGRWA